MPGLRNGMWFKLSKLHRALLGIELNTFRGRASCCGLFIAVSIGELLSMLLNRLAYLTS